MRNFKFTFETDSQEEATMFLKTIQKHEENDSVSSLMPKRATEPPPPMPKRATEPPPPVPKRATEPPPPVPKRATEPPPPVPQNLDVKKTRAEINDELARIFNGGNDARHYLIDNGYDGINDIPENFLVQFLTMLKGEHVNG